MKKNLITVIILALVVVNLVLTAVLTITIIPETQKANELITKVCSAIDLDLQAGDTAGSLSIDVADMVDYPVNSGETLTINLVDGYAVLGISLSLDSTNEDYATYAPDGTLSGQDNIISDKINSVIKKHTVQEMIDNEDQIKE